MAVDYHEMMAAKALLNLPDRASMSDIKSIYRKLLKQWHPDKCKCTGGNDGNNGNNGNNASDEKCHQMTQKITAAYKTVVSYCQQYQYVFTKEEFKRYLSVEDWWFDRFGDDPLMGKIKK